MSTLLSQVADLLAEATRSGLPIAPVRSLLPEGDIDAAYAVQKINTERLEAGTLVMAGGATAAAALEHGTIVCCEMQSLGRGSLVTAPRGQP